MEGCFSFDLCQPFKVGQEVTPAPTTVVEVTPSSSVPSPSLSPCVVDGSSSWPLGNTRSQEAVQAQYLASTPSSGKLVSRRGRRSVWTTRNKAFERGPDFPGGGRRHDPDKDVAVQLRCDMLPPLHQPSRAVFDRLAESEHGDGGGHVD